MAPGFRGAGPSSPSCGGIWPAMGTWFCGSGGGGLPGPKPRDVPGGPWASFCPNRVENISVISPVNNTSVYRGKASLFECFASKSPQIRWTSISRFYTSLWVYFHGPLTVMPRSRAQVTVMTLIWTHKLIGIPNYCHHIHYCYFSTVHGFISIFPPNI